MLLLSLCLGQLLGREHCGAGVVYCGGKVCFSKDWGFEETFPHFSYLRNLCDTFRKKCVCGRVIIFNWKNTRHREV